MCGQHAFATDAGLDLSVSLTAQSPHAPGAPPDLVAALVWPDPCLPTLERASMSTGHIDLELRAGSAACAAAPTPLALRVNPARASGLNDFQGGLYEVRVYLREASAPPRLVAFRWLDASVESGPIHPESGFWWPSRSGDGAVGSAPVSSVTIERQGGRIAVTLLGFANGAPTWYFGTADLVGNTARVRLMRMLGGNDAPGVPPRATIAEAGPALHLNFSSPARAEARLEQPLPGADLGIDLQPIALTRLAFEPGRAGASWLGTWVYTRVDSSEARLIAFSATRSSDAESFGLVDMDGDATLECRQGSAAALPETCVFRMGGAPDAIFDRVGLDRFEGRTADGTSVRLVRMPD
ncbi:MAG: hypothetical protein J0L88_04025 [Xanthomonadales bacterium]|nr:hypothetical protein [Xanthomonadales bacterium]